MGEEKEAFSTNGERDMETASLHESKDQEEQEEAQGRRKAILTELMERNCGDFSGGMELACEFSTHLDVGLKIIENDRDLDVLYEYAHDHGVIQVYITHGPQDLSSYYVENLCLYGSEDDVNSRRKSVPKDAGNISVQELVSWAEDEAALGSLAEEETIMGSIAIDDDICVTGVVDKGKGLADKGKGLVDKGKGIMEYEGKSLVGNSGIVIGENVNPTFSEDDDTDSERDIEQRIKATVDLEEVFKGMSDTESEYSDKSVDYLSEGEDELISLRKRQSKVDGCLDPLYNTDNDQIKEKFPTHDDQTHWKMRKPKVGEKYANAAQLKECLTYYSLANGYSLWFYRSSNDSLIARCGMMLTESSFQEHYGMIRSYGKEILDINDGSTVKLGVTVNPDDKTYFDRDGSKPFIHSLGNCECLKKTKGQWVMVFRTNMGVQTLDIAIWEMGLH
ncbi:hypothetical protein Tco_0798289 [Tanacetum coccineum]